MHTGTSNENIPLLQKQKTLHAQIIVFGLSIALGFAGVLYQDIRFEILACFAVYLYNQFFEWKTLTSYRVQKAVQSSNVGQSIKEIERDNLISTVVIAVSISFVTTGLGLKGVMAGATLQALGCIVLYVYSTFLRQAHTPHPEA